MNTLTRSFCTLCAEHFRRRTDRASFHGLLMRGLLNLCGLQLFFLNRFRRARGTRARD